MATMPGEPVELEPAWSPDAPEDKRRQAYKPDMAEVKPVQTFTGPDEKDPATYVEPKPASLYERFKGNLRAWQEGGSVHMYEMGAIRDQLNQRDILPDGKGGVYQQTEEDAQADADYIANQMEAERFSYEHMDAADTPLEQAVGFAGGVVGALADPINLINPEAKLGTTAWRLRSPIKSKMLDFGVSNGALNAIQSWLNQEGEVSADMRDGIDWKSILIDAGIGVGIGTPLGYFSGKAAMAEAAKEKLLQDLLDASRKATPPKPGTAPMAPRPDKPAPTEENYLGSMGQADVYRETTVESLSAAHNPEEIQAAQETLFGEAVGTRNLTPEQLQQVDDYINAGKPYGETVQDMPPAREPAQPQAEPLPQVPEQRQPEGSANPAPANEGPERAKGVPPSATYVGLNADGNQVWEWQHKDGPRRIEVRPGKSVSMENPSMLSGPGFTPYVRNARFEVATPAQAPKAPEPAPLAGGYQDFRPADLKVDASRFQFKGGGDEQGVVDTLKKVKKWDPNKAGVVIVWQDLAGNNYIVDGHQRYGLAKRLAGEGQDPILHAKVWREADGITAEDAKVLAADINISQGSGTAIDAAKILRSRPEMLDNLPKNAVTDHGVGLAKLSDDAFGMVVNGKVPPEYGAIVGKLAPNTSTHAQIMDVLAKNEPASAAQAESMVRDVLSAPEVEQTMADMFGSSEVTQILFKERAQVLSSAATALRKDRAAFNTLVKEEARLTGAGNKLATATNLERAQTDAEILATLQATARRKGPIADALAAAAKSLHDGTPRQVAVREFLDRIRGEVKGASPDGAGLPASPQSIAARLGGYRDTDSPAFQRWFGDSKVVDENGDPLVVYHGTGWDVSTLEPNVDDGSIFFTPSRDLASEYAVWREDLRSEDSSVSPNVMPSYLSIRNPLVIEMGGKGFRSQEQLEILRRAQDEGRDGVIFKNMRDGITAGGGAPTDVYAVFSPTQIKSIYNRGTWDAQDPRISFSAPRQAGPGLFDAPPPKAGALSPQMERMLTLAKGKMGAPDNIYGDQINEALRKGWVTGEEGYTKAGGNRVTRYHITPAGEAALAGKFDVGADGKPQAVLPGAERIGDKSLAERRAAAPLKATKPQKALDFGLFGDGGNQMDLVDLARIPKMVKQDADYLDFTPSPTARNAIIGKASITYAAKDGEVEIISFRVPTQFRRQGEGREALLAFLEKADDEGLAVRAYSTPLDRSTDPEGVVRFYESLGFTATGRKIDRAGNLEMLRSGPPPEVAELRQLVGSGRLIPLRDYTDPAMAQQVSSAFYNTQPARTIEALYDGGVLQKHQDRLATVGKEIAIETGASFKNPGIKKKETAAEKMIRKRYKSTKQLADLVRAGFLVETPDQAQRVVNMLAQAFKVLDEGWAITPHGYFDRKVMVQFADGTIGEVQIWEPNLFDAKFKRGGTELYTASRSAPPGPERQALEDEMTKLYSDVLEGLDPSWLATVGRGGNVPNVPENVSRISSSEPSNLPESPTSGESTSSQSSPRSSTAQARPSDMTAGRPSQSTNFMEPSVSGEGIAFAARPQPGSNMPVNRSQAGVPMPGTSRRAPRPGRLEEVGNVLRQVTGAPVRQGRLARAPAGQRVAGQYNRGDGVIRLRDATDFETQTHETAHSLETEWGRTLDSLKQVHRAELEPLAYAGADPRQTLSEGFAEWFRFFVTTPNYARRVAPQFTDAFIRMLEAGDRMQLDRIREAQARYNDWSLAPSAAVVSDDIVSSRKGNVLAEAVAEAGGYREALGEFLSKGYTSTIDKLHPINRAVDELMKVYEKRTGKALDITSAQDPYRLARLTADSFAAGHVDAMHGVVPYRGVASEGPSLSDAITTALGAQWKGWDDTAMADFAAYLVSRRAIREYDRFMAGEIPNPPGKFTRGDYEVTIQELEAAHPNYAVAADMVYEWGRNMLRKKYESGFIGQELYDELVKRQDYVPFMRDLRDLDKEAGEGTGNKTLRSAIMKAFKGSKRSVINPLESMLADAYQFNALMKRNEVFRALEDLATMAGPGSGAIVERIPAHQLNPTKVKVDEVLKAAAKDVGLSPQDADQLTTFVDTLLGDDASATLFRAGQINEKGEPIIYTWRDGKQHALRLADGEFGRDLYNAMTGMNKEMSNLFVNILALPSTVVRYGVTTAPHFIMANYIRDQISAWVLTDGYVPFISGILGIKDEITQAEVTRIYNSFGGIMGGGNVASLDKGRAKRDINALNKAGYHVKRFAGIRGFAEFTGISETGTRLAVFKNSFKRAKKGGLTDYEAAVEAAYQARDYIDFGRHGSQTHAARRLVTFLNASLQGLDKTTRVLTAEGALKKAIAPFINHKAGRPLSARDKANLGKAAAAWAKMTAVGTFGLGLSVLYSEDPEYEEISDYLKATHWMVKKGPGDWYAIPKPFELGFVSNLFERSYEAVYKGNPIAMQSFLAGLYEVTAPPMGIPFFETFYELQHNKDGMGRDIVPQDIAGFEPWRQYTAQTSEIAKAMGYATNLSPMKIDHALQGFGASWGKIITDASVARAQEKNPVDIITESVTNRFVRDVTRGATSSLQFWSLVSEGTGTMAASAATYKDLLEHAGPTQAEQMLASKDENTKVYSLMEALYPAEVRRLNPLVRAKDAISVLSKVRKEMAGNALVNTEESSDDEEVKIPLSPSTRQMANDLIARIAMIEARNSLIVMGVPGWKQKVMMETESLYEDLRTASPELADEIEARMTKKKVYDFNDVKENWPDVKARVLEDRQDADFSDITAGME